MRPLSRSADSVAVAGAGVICVNRHFGEDYELEMKADEVDISLLLDRVFLEVFEIHDVFVVFAAIGDLKLLVGQGNRQSVLI